MVHPKLRFLCIVGTKLRTEVMALGCPPKFAVAIAQTEQLVAERTAGGAPGHQISATCEHQVSPPKNTL